MENSVYKIHRAINQSIVVKGLQLRYMAYLAAGLVMLLLLFTLLQLLQVGGLFSAGFTGLLALLLSCKIYQMSNTYGEFGLLKALAAKRIPKCIRFRSRSVFFSVSAKSAV